MFDHFIPHDSGPDPHGSLPIKLSIDYHQFECFRMRSGKENFIFFPFEMTVTAGFDLFHSFRLSYGKAIKTF